MTDEDKQDRRESYEVCKPFVRTLAAILLAAGSVGSTSEQCYTSADLFLSQLEKDLA